MPFKKSIENKGFVDGIRARPRVLASHIETAARNFRGAWFVTKSSTRRAFPLVLAGFLILMEAVVPMIAFEAHVINVTAKIEPIPCMLANFDNDALGDNILPGERIDNEYTPWGLGISAFNNNRDDYKYIYKEVD